jgi:hypothetical protein
MEDPEVSAEEEQEFLETIKSWTKNGTPQVRYIPVV